MMSTPLATSVSHAEATKPCILLTTLWVLAPKRARARHIKNTKSVYTIKVELSFALGIDPLLTYINAPPDRRKRSPQKGFLWPVGALGRWGVWRSGDLWRPETLETLETLRARGQHKGGLKGPEMCTEGGRRHWRHWRHCYC